MGVGAVPLSFPHLRALTKPQSLGAAPRDIPNLQIP